jgi:AcrR family transcriptional regulator
MTVLAPPVDRRVERTREALLDALAHLLAERGYERLTIQQILDRADIGRATFYAHFASKDDLLAASVGRLRAWLQQAWRAGSPQPLGFSLPFFQHLLAHRRIYHFAVVRERETTVQRHIRQMLLELVHEDLCAYRAQSVGDSTVNLAAQYVTGALWATVAWWMDTGTPLTPEEINRQFQRMTFPGLASLLGASWLAVGVGSLTADVS